MNSAALRGESSSGTRSAIEESSVGCEERCEPVRTGAARGACGGPRAPPASTRLRRRAPIRHCIQPSDLKSAQHERRPRQSAGRVLGSFRASARRNPTSCIWRCECNAARTCSASKPGPDPSSRTRAPGGSSREPLDDGASYLNAQRPFSVCRVGPCLRVLRTLQVLAVRYVLIRLSQRCAPFVESIAVRYRAARTCPLLPNPAATVVETAHTLRRMKRPTFGTRKERSSPGRLRGGGFQARS